jgi:hypothetical protein
VEGIHERRRETEDVIVSPTTSGPGVFEVEAMYERIVGDMRGAREVLVSTHPLWEGMWLMGEGVGGAADGDGEGGVEGEVVEGVSGWGCRRQVGEISSGRPGASERRC